MNTHQYQGLFVFQVEKKISLVYRLPAGKMSSLGIAESTDGTSFISTRKTVSFTSKLGAKQSTDTWESFRVSTLVGGLTLSYSKDPSKPLLLAQSKKGYEWKGISSKNEFRHETVFMDSSSKEKKAAQVLAFSKSGRNMIELSLSDHTLARFQNLGVVLEARKQSFDASSLSPFYAGQVKQGTLLLYTAKNQQGLLTVSAALFDPENPGLILWRSGSPLWTAPSRWYGKKIAVLGGAEVGKYFYGYFQCEHEGVDVFPMPRLWETYAPSKKIIHKTPHSHAKRSSPASVPHRLIRHEENPILTPLSEHSWEALSAFNAAAVAIDGDIHLLYRAQGHDGISVLGYAKTENGTRVTERLSMPAFVPRNPFDERKKNTPKNSFPYLSGGGWGGCEDPRVTRIEGMLYMTYVAFNGIHPPGVALTSISLKNFLKKKWDWKTPKLISCPGTIQKNWVLFPEKIKGKYAILHNISPRIRIEYLDSLEGDILIESTPPRKGPEDAARWDNIVRGVGAPPIKTDEGWLVFYHAMDERDPNKYKIGAMLLDLDNPERVITRAREPVLEPETDYENHGYKHGVVYVCGSVIRNGTLFVYYGASDKTLAVASTPLRPFIDALKDQKIPKFKSFSLS